MANVIIKGKEYRGVPSIRLPQPGGGFVKFTEGGGVAPAPEWNWMGEEAECIEPNLFSLSKALEDTDYATWTPSTTSATIIPSTSLDAIAVDTGTYNYLIKWMFDVSYVYGAGSENKAKIIRQVVEDWIMTLKRPNNLTNLEAGVMNYNGYSVFSVGAFSDYYYSSGNRSFSAAVVSYGATRSITAPTYSNSTSDTPSLTIKTPKISAACSNYYFSTTNAAAVDQHNSIVKVKGELWRVKRSNIAESIISDTVNLWNNPI